MMKKTITVSLGRRSYLIDDDAYGALQRYLEKYQSCIKYGYQPAEVMEELETGIADHFDLHITNSNQVVDINLVQSVVKQIGLPDGEYSDVAPKEISYLPPKGERKLFLDKQNGAIGGVCAGLGAYFDLDILLIRILFLLTLGYSFWVYIILWIISPKAITPEQKCQMRGWAITEENINRVSKFE